LTSLVAAALLCAAVPGLADDPPEEPLPLTFKDPAVFCTVPGACNPSSPHHPLGMVVADLIDQDDYPDVAVVNSSHQSVSVFRNTGGWSSPNNALTHAPGSPYMLDGRTPYDVDAGDLDGDLDLDLVITVPRSGTFPGFTPGELIILYYDSQLGAFGNLEHVPLSDAVGDPPQGPAKPDPRGLEIGDFNQDGRMDIAVASSSFVAPFTFTNLGRVEVLYGQPGGSWSRELFDFQAEGVFACTEIVTARMSEHGPSGYKDLVVGTFATNLNEPKLIILLNNLGQFTPLVQDSGTNTLGIAVGRFGSDQCRDVVATRDTAGPDSIDLFSGTCTGFINPATPPSYALFPSTDPYGVDVGKLNLDGQRDIVVAAQHGEPCGGLHGGVAVYLGNADGTFQEPAELFCVDPDDPPKPCFVKIADMNQDTLNDIVTSNADSGKISVLINDSNSLP